MPAGDARRGDPRAGILDRRSCRGLVRGQFRRRNIDATATGSGVNVLVRRGLRFHAGLLGRCEGHVHDLTQLVLEARRSHAPAFARIGALMAELIRSWFPRVHPTSIDLDRAQPNPHRGM